MNVDEIMSSVGDSVLYTLHAHTQFCDARAPMHDFVEKAAAMGFTHYGFTPHSPIPFESSCNMSQLDVPVYFAEVERLQALYPQVKLFKGMEIDYVDDSCCASNEYFQTLGLDYSIGSVHFIPTQDGEYVDIDGRPESFYRKLQDKFHNDLHYVVDKFFEQSQRMMAAGGFEIIGHFDKIKLNAGIYWDGLEKTDFYNARVNDLIDSIIASGVIVEINTKSWKDFHHFFPSQRHWRRLIDANVPIVVNSDAHYVDRINASRPEVIKALRYLKTH